MSSSTLRPRSEGRLSPPQNPLSSEDRSRVRAQLVTILAHHSFKNSKRCVKLLQYLVDKVLDNDIDSMKERALGIEVFDRGTDYEPSLDPVVRTTANEIRKRLAQFYQESMEPADVRIELLSGSYIPRFEIIQVGSEAKKQSEPFAPSETKATIAAAAVVFSAPPVTSLQAGVASSQSTRRKFVLAAATGVLLVSAGAAYRASRRSDATGVERFWGPVLHSQDRALMCVSAPMLKHDVTPEEVAKEINGLLSGTLMPSQMLSSMQDSTARPNLALSDALVATMLSGYLGKHDARLLIRNVTEVGVLDMHSGPIILIGLFDNPWALWYSSRFRYRPQVDMAKGEMWVEDSQHPERQDWKARWNAGYADSEYDYAIVTRFKDSETGNVGYILGGLGLHGTKAIGQLVIDPQYLDKLDTAIADPNKNVQLVIKTKVVGGVDQLPEVIAVHYW